MPTVAKSATVHTIKPAPKKRASAPKSGKAAEKSTSATSNRPKITKTNGAISDTERRNYIEIAAYYIAQRRGFTGGSQLEDWIRAEQEIDLLLK